MLLLGYLSMLILHIPQLLFLHIETSCVVCFPNLDEVSFRFNIFGCCLLLMLFVASHVLHSIIAFMLFFLYFEISLKSSALF